MFVKYPENFRWEGRIITFKPDEFLHDNDVIKLGNTTVEVVKERRAQSGSRFLLL